MATQQTAEQKAAAEAAEAQKKADEEAAAEAARVAEANAKANAEANAGKVQVQFNRPLSLGGIDYEKGTHYVPEEHIADNWFYDANVKDGNIVEVSTAAADGRPRKSAKK